MYTNMFIFRRGHKIPLTNIAYYCIPEFLSLKYIHPVEYHSHNFGSKKIFEIFAAYTSKEKKLYIWGIKNFMFIFAFAFLGLNILFIYFL